MKKAYLLTIHYINNYGSVLQTFASQKYFELHGYDCSVINYTRDNATREGVYKDFYKIYRECNDIRSNKLCAYLLAKRAEHRFINKSKLFDEFRKKYLRLTDGVNKEQLYTLFKEDALYIVGSDQTWNYEYNGGFLPEYYLAFVNKGEKISFSSSIGNEHFHTSEVKHVKKFLSDFRFITVREGTAVSALKEIGIDNSIHVLDPTLLLSGEEWVCNMNIEKKGNNYVLIYQLNYNTELTSFAQQLAKKMGLRLIRIHTFDFKDNIEDLKKVDPVGFCQLFFNARVIVTDSFHGTAFSINFNKEFYSFNPPKYSTRIKSILRLCKLEDRLITEANCKNRLDNQINYEQVNLILQNERRKVEKLMDMLIGEEDGTNSM